MCADARLRLGEAWPWVMLLMFWCVGLIVAGLLSAWCERHDALAEREWNRQLRGERDDLS